jgi:nucleotide-binding universal stress UspA family protein
VYRSLLLPTDGSEAAEAGLQEGLRLAKALKARVAFLYVLEPLGPKLLLGPETLPYYRELVEDLRREGLAALDRATPDGGGAHPLIRSFRSLPSSKSTRLAKRLSERPALSPSA